MNYPNKYNAPDDEIELDQHMRAYYKAINEAENLANSDAARQCYREQAEAEIQHIQAIRRRVA